MARSLLLLLLLATTFSGCLGSTPDEEATPLDGQAAAPAASLSRVLLVDHAGGALFSMYTPYPACEHDGAVFSDNPEADQYERYPGGKIGPDHTRLEVEVVVRDAFSDAGLTGHRVGAFYDGEPVFWTEAATESGSFQYELDGTRYDVEGGPQWTFFYKRADATTQDDEDACASGFSSGGFDVRIYATRPPQSAPTPAPS